MEFFKIENLSFTYPGRAVKTLDGINLTVNSGEFITICGKSGCGKTTLLRLMKSSLTHHGELSGNIFFKGKPLEAYGTREQAADIGFVMQSPDNQIVTDKVWHELAFGLESLGYSTPEIRTRVSEMASFFDIQTWFYKNVTELSGGQKQLLNLASVMVMQPSVLILDEPTSQLDPIAAQEFLKTLEKINRDLGVAVILTEHRLEDAFPISDRVVVMDEGRIIADDNPRIVGDLLKKTGHDMCKALPAPMRVCTASGTGYECPMTVREGRVWLESFSREHTLDSSLIPTSALVKGTDNPVVEIKDVWFRYEKNLPDVIKGLNLKVDRGEIFSILGGNGTGKTTALSLISGLNTPYRGEVLINGKSVKNTSGLYKGLLGVLPQNPQMVFVKKTVYLDLEEILGEQKLSKEETEQRIHAISSLCHIENLLDSHPYDLSGGEQQRAALAKVLLTEPEILLLDEPTKGMDAHFKEEFADILSELKVDGVTVIMVSHDIEFCAAYSDRCALFFDGSITSLGTPRDFFAGNSFYTTSANRMARSVLPDAVLPDDIILACGGKPERKKKPVRSRIDKINRDIDASQLKKKSVVISPARIVTGVLFALLFAVTSVAAYGDFEFFSGLGTIGMASLQIISIMEAAVSLFCFFPQKEFDISVIHMPRSERKLTKRTVAAALMILIAIPLTIYTGVYFLGDRKYYFISLLIILETMIPFCMVFESRKPKARELVVISVLCALSVAGRAAFFMLPQFKPVVALVIVAGVCFGGEAGFLIGAVSGFVSNFFFGQGTWTPWQMFAFGIIGFLAGIFFKKGLLKRNKASMCIFGFTSTLVIYGGIMNPASIIMMQSKITAEMIVSSYIVGIPFDLVHALSTAFFLWFISETMIDKLERVKIKYGLVER